MMIFLAGATGAVGRRLVPLLVDAGHKVAGTTRSPEKATLIEASGVEPVVVDAYDADGLTKAVRLFRPDIIINQLTDLPASRDPATFGEAGLRNAKLWKLGTKNLIRAAKASGVGRMIAQSVAFAYAPGPEPYGEDDPLDVTATGDRAITVDAVTEKELPVLETPGISGIVLRYGYFYGPGTWYEDARQKPSVHVDAAAHAAFLAVEHGEPGTYNIADSDDTVKIDKARKILRWYPGFRLPAALVAATTPVPAGTDG